MPKISSGSSSDEDTENDSDTENSGDGNGSKRGKSAIKLRLSLTEEEVKYRKKNFDSIEELLSKQVRCTSCAKELRSRIVNGSEVLSHPVLDVLLCKDCYRFYGNGDFSVDDDGTDKYCRWCGQGGTLYCCAECTCAFCKACIKRNLKRSILKDIESEDWKCFVCYGKPLWDLRAICWASKKYSEQVRREQRLKNQRALEKLKERRMNHVPRRKTSIRPHNMRTKTDATEVIDIDSGSDDSTTASRKLLCSSENKKRTLFPENDKKTGTKSDNEGEDICETDNHEYKGKRKTPDKSDCENNIKVGRGRRSSDEDNDISQESYALDRENTREICRLLAEQLKDFVSTGEIISDQAKKILKRKVNKKNFKELLDVDKTVEKIQLLAELSVKNLEKAKTNTRTLYSQWRKDLAIKNRNKHAQDKTRKFHVNADCQILVDKPSACSKTTLSEKEIGSPKPVHSDHEGSDREQCSPLMPNMLLGTSTPCKEGKMEAEEDQNNTVVCQSDETALKTVNDSVLQSNDNKISPQKSDCDEQKSKYEDESAITVENERGNLFEKNLSAISQMATEILDLEAVTNPHQKDNMDCCVNSDESTEMLDLEADTKLHEDSTIDNCQPDLFDVELQTTEKTSSDKIDTMGYDVQEQLSTELIDTMERILVKVEENISRPDMFVNTDGKLQSSPLRDSHVDAVESDKENKFSSIALKSKEKLLEVSSEDNPESDSTNHSDEEAQRKKRKKRKRLSLRNHPSNSKVPADKNTLKKKKHGLRGLPSCSDSDSESSLDSAKIDKYGQQEKFDMKYLAQFNDEKLRSGCYVKLERLASFSNVENNCDMDNGPDIEKSNKSRNIISGSDAESMDDNEEEREIRRLLSLKSIKKKSLNFKADLSDADSDGSRGSSNKKVKNTKSDKKLDEEQTESLLSVHKKVMDGDTSTDSDTAGEDYCPVSEGQPVKPGKQDDKVTGNHDEIAKQLLLHDSSDSDSSVPLHQQCQSPKSVDKKKEVVEESSPKECVKTEENDGQQEETDMEENIKEKNSPEPVKKDHQDDEKEIPEGGGGGGGGKNKKEGCEGGELSVKIDEDKCENQNKENKPESEEESDNTAEEVEAKMHSKAEEELNKSTDCKESKEEDKKSTEETKENKSKSTWRNDKLLRAKLSETDTSDEERKWNARKKKKEADDSSDSPSGATPLIQRKKKRKRIVDSDSCSDIKSGSESSDLEALFGTKRKRKHKSESSDIDSSSSSPSSIELKKKPKRRRVVVASTGSSGSDTDDLNSTQKSEGTPGKGRKNIRRVLKDENVAEATKRAAREEEERKKRIAEKQKMYNELFKTDQGNVEKLDKLVLDFDQETKEEVVTVHKDIVTKLKPHQVKGVKFMWDTCFESVEQIKESKGTGCILAHCMGLGKSLQVVALVHTVLCNSATSVKTVLIICPYSTIKNWVNEFQIWLKDLPDSDEIEVYELTNYKKNYERMYQLKKWHEEGGVMVMGYEMYRNLAGNEKLKARKQMKENFHNILVDPGPDLIVCDEGHLLKNENSAISKALRKIRTLRRIVLTGTPLQNNLNEYHCMVQFVKPNLLGSKKEFDNRFVNPIRNGQYVDSTLHDVKVMKRRAHVLHKMLESSVQRFDYGVLTPFLPPKHEYVISVRLSETQVKLYRYYLDNFSAASELNEPTRGKGAKLFADFQALQRIWTHPRVIRMDADKKEKDEEKKQMMASDSEGSLKDFVVDDSTTDSDETSNDSGNEKDDDKKDSSDNDIIEITEKENEEEEQKSSEWWEQFVTEEEMDDIKSSGKLMLLFYILQECEKIGDKVLVFSQSLLTLDLIEYFLAKVDEATQKNSDSNGSQESFTGSWSPGLDYFRLDGSTSAENRSIWCKSFNKESNYRARLFLISTRAGGLGINLVAANRVVLFDASWNPSHDVQSIFRIYRFGQKKPCYVYRFLAQGTMEEKIYDRQVTKLSLSCRVVDEQQIERHYNMADLQEMYMFDPEQVSKRPTPLLPKDRLLAELLKEHEYWVITYHEHDSLLQNKEEEELNEEERKAAWEEYENEKQGKVPPPAFAFMNQNMGMHQGSVGQLQIPTQLLRDMLRRENPQSTEIQISERLNTVISNISSLIANNQMVGGTEYEGYLKLLQQQYIQDQMRKESQFVSNELYLNAGHPVQPLYSNYFVKKAVNPIQRTYMRNEVAGAPSTSKTLPMIKNVKDFGQMRAISPTIMQVAQPKTYGGRNLGLQMENTVSSLPQQHTPSDDSIEIID
ncbi:transcriptional regulator ATRX homolog isoform X1 [Schistocerca piceifrons]|uniref:transcriptional regulator ATRX homolog isoform X1 n=1 Tax=Schistocerca piceifrons TaxID=274613 RepID=UPI001F5F4A3F|nr:transcriptional regulator ATRX homolog isoform X1 [Schistocerca piceifrons]